MATTTLTSNVLMHLNLAQIFLNKLESTSKTATEKEFRSLWCDLLRPAAYGALQGIHAILTSALTDHRYETERTLFAAAVLNIDLFRGKCPEIFRATQDVLKYVCVDVSRRAQRMEEPLESYLYDSSIHIPDCIKCAKRILAATRWCAFDDWQLSLMDAHTITILLRNSGLSDYNTKAIERLLYNLYHTNLNHPTRNADELFCLLANEHRMGPLLLMGVGLQPCYIPHRLSLNTARRLANDLDDLVQYVYYPNNSWAMLVFVSILCLLTSPPALTAQFIPYQFPSAVLFYNLDGSRSFVSPFYIVANDIPSASRTAHMLSTMLITNNPEVAKIMEEAEAEDEPEQEGDEKDNNEDEEDDCFFCCNMEVTHYASPCAHLYMCSSCASKMERLDRCAVCMCTVEGIYKLEE